MLRTELYDKPLPVFAWLAVIRGAETGRAMRLQENTRIGRDGMNNELILTDSIASAEHACIRLEERHFVLYDLGSLNGTYVNNKRIERVVLMDGDHIRIGETEMVFKRV